MRGRAIIILALCLSVAGCGWFKSDRRAQSDRALPFRARLSQGAEPREFTVSVSNRGHGVEEVRESVRFQATKYCLYAYGGSDAAWDIDAETGDWDFVEDGGKLIFSGRCTKR